MNDFPVIGISAGYVNHAYHTEGSYVHQDFISSVSNNGGLPIIIPYDVENTKSVEALQLCDGVIISGGEDVHPKFYGQEPHQDLGGTILKRDEAEIALVKHAIEHNIPILAVCRGIQILNVALGGTLIQDISSYSNEFMQHFQKGTHLYYDTHSIQIEKGSKLYEVFEDETGRVNSFHHQAIDILGEKLKATAKAPDGIVEGVEHIDHPYAVGVQFHPEFMASTNPLMNKLFIKFIEASKLNKVKPVIK